MSDFSRLEARIAALEATVAELRNALVTRRVAVVDDAGIERVILSADARTGSVLVRLDRPPGATTGVELFACEPLDEEPLLGLCTLTDGNVTPPA